jgi:hypothetical protein
VNPPTAGNYTLKVVYTSTKGSTKTYKATFRITS